MTFDLQKVINRLPDSAICIGGTVAVGAAASTAVTAGTLTSFYSMLSPLQKVVSDYLESNPDNQDCAELINQFASTVKDIFIVLGTLESAVGFLYFPCVLFVLGAMCCCLIQQQSSLPPSGPVAQLFVAMLACLLFLPQIIATMTQDQLITYASRSLANGDCNLPLNSISDLRGWSALATLVLNPAATVAGLLAVVALVISILYGISKYSDCQQASKSRFFSSADPEKRPLAPLAAAVINESMDDTSDQSTPGGNTPMV